MEIQLATENDLPEIVKMNLREYGISEEEKAYRFEELQWWGDLSLLEWHYSILKESGGGIIVAKVDNEIVGQLDYTVSIEDERLHIVWLLVDKEYRGRGIARKLIAELRKIADKKGMSSIWAEAEDERTEKLYLSEGKITDYLENYWIDLNFDLDHEEMDNNLVFKEGELYEVLPKQPTKLNRTEVIDGTKERKITDLFKGRRRVLGDYLTKEFDLLQMIKSKSTVAQPFVWGETPMLQIVKYPLQDGEIVAILTQYVRVYASGQYTENELENVLKGIIHRIFQLQFLAIDIQVLKSKKLGDTLQQLGFLKIEEDPVFDLFR